MPGPEIYMPGAAGLFDEATGKLKNDETKKLVTNFMQSFATWISRFK